MNMLHRKSKYLIPAMIFVIMFFNPVSSLFADVKLYLYPKIDKGGDTLIMKDIASIDCDPSADGLKAIEIDSSLYRDGYLDKKEIMSILKANTDEIVLIYGNAVRIFSKSGNEEVNTDIDNLQIKIGQRISLRVRNKGITLELPGIVISKEDEGRGITVRLDKKFGNSRLVKCELTEDGSAEVNL